jgi:hypothetical protein
VVLVTGDVDLNVLHTDDRLNDPDRLASIIEKGTLFDVRLNIRGEEFSRHPFGCLQLRDALEHLTKSASRMVRPIPNRSKSKFSCPDPAAQQWLERALFVGEGHDSHTGKAGLPRCTGYLQAANNAVATVEPPTFGLRI